MITFAVQEEVYQCDTPKQYKTSEIYKITVEYLLHNVVASDVTTLTATGIHLRRINEVFDNIPKLNNGAGKAFTWTGDMASTLASNIIGALSDGYTLVIDDPEQYNEEL